MKKLCLLLGTAALLLSGCDGLIGDGVIRGTGRVITEDRSLARFYGVSNATEARVEIIQGNRQNVRIEAEENLISHLRTRVEGGLLRIYTETGTQLDPSREMIIEIDMGDLELLMSSGSGDIDAPLIDARKLEVFSSGSGDIRLPDLLADSIIIFGSGSGHVIVNGDVIRNRITVSGSGDIDTRDLEANVVDAVLSGSGQATVRARDILRAVLSGSGSLRYYGNPGVQQTATGSGRVQRLGS